MPNSAFPSRSLSFATLLRRAASLSVPVFQRPFAWTTKEAGQLLEDIAAAAGTDGELDRPYDYFLGTILVLCAHPPRLLGDAPLADGQNGHRHEALNRTPGGALDVGSIGAGGRCEIIDGQQRLVTLTILAAALRDLDDAPDSPTRDDIQAVLARAGDRDRASYKVCLHEGEQPFFVKYVLEPLGCAEMPVDEGELSRAQTSILAIREHFTSELAQLPNSERQRLARYLLDHCHLVVIATDEIDRAHNMFVVLNDRGLPLRREDILKAELAQGLSRDKAEATLARWDRVSRRLGSQFETLFGHIRTIHGETRPQIISAIRSIVASRGGGEAFITRDLEPLGEALAAAINPWDEASDVSMEVRRRLVYLNRLSGTEWVPAAMMALRPDPAAPERAEMLIAGIDRLAHVQRLMCIGRNKRQQRFAAVLEAIADGSILSAQDGPFALTRDELRVLYFNLRDIHARAPSVAKLLLMRLDDEITGLLPAYDPADFSVEHVLPLRPSAQSAWRRAIPDANIRSECTHSLGNLTLLTQRQNDLARNKDFERKRAIYEAPEVGRPVLALTREVIAETSWGAEQISAREARLMALVRRIWQLPPPPPGPGASETTGAGVPSVIDGGDGGDRPRPAPGSA